MLDTPLTDNSPTYWPDTRVRGATLPALRKVELDVVNAPVPLLLLQVGGLEFLLVLVAGRVRLLCVSEQGFLR